MVDEVSRTVEEDVPIGTQPRPDAQSLPLQIFRLLQRHAAAVLYALYFRKKYLVADLINL